MKNEGSGESEAKCHARKSGHDSYCDVSAEFLHVPQYWDTPASPGCYLKWSTHSRKCGGPHTHWKLDDWGMKNEESGKSEAKCHARKSGHDSYCDTSAEFLFVPESPESLTTPTSPGCYFKQASHSSKCGGPHTEWEKDAWGMQNAESGDSETKCRSRKSGHDSYCEVSSEWLFVPHGGFPIITTTKFSPHCSLPHEDCRSTTCCSDSSKTCYLKNAHWASCLDSCAPGIHDDDPPKHQTPWECSALGHRPEQLVIA